MYQKSSIVSVIVFVISLGLSISAGRTIVNLWQRRGLVSQRQQELIQLQEKNKALDQKKQEIQGEAYVERIARDFLGMVKEGETIVIVPQGTVYRGRGTGTPDPNLPNWKKWLRLFFE